MLANDSSVIAILPTVEALRPLIARHPLRIQSGWDFTVGAEMAALHLTNAQWELHRAHMQAQLVAVRQFKVAQEQDLQRRCPPPSGAMTGQVGPSYLTGGGGAPPPPLTAILGAESARHDTVRWQDAMNYITTVKHRFASKPEIYHKFLNILLSYKKHQHETNEVFYDVSPLFANHAKLLTDFKSTVRWRDASAAATSDEEAKPKESSNQDSLVKLLSNKEKLEAYTRETLQKFQEKYLAALQECKAKLKENHDKFEKSQTRSLVRTTQVEAILVPKGKQIKTAAAKDERIMTLETTLDCRDQDLALKDKDILAIVSILRSKDQKITDLEAALRNSKPIDVVDLTRDGNLDCTNEPTGPPSKLTRVEHEEVHSKSFLQSIVRVKEERQAAVTALADVRDDLDIEKDTVTQQEIFLTAWMKKFDELAGIARNAGVDGAVMKSIRDRSVL